MLVSCPKCTSRYQLGDDKIKSSGTKVRCPRCQHTFKVFQTAPEDEVSEDRTELFMTREPAPVATPVAKPPTPAAKQQDEKTVTRREKSKEEEKLIDSRAHTEIHAQGTAAAASETQRSTKPKKDASPFKKKYAETEISDASTENSEEVADSNSDFPGFSERPFARDPARSEKTDKKSAAVVEEQPEPAEETPAPRPFGDATFLAIQKMGSGKQGKRRALVAFSLILIVVAGFFLLTRAPGDPNTRDLALVPSKTDGVRLNRPNKWYEDEPQVFQRFLSQMATLPQSEQIQTKNRALIADALILNGNLTGNFDQVAQGIGFASSLLISAPNDVFGYYGLSTSAWLKDDMSTLTDLVNRWPAGNRNDLEFKLGSLLIGSRAGQKVAALELGKTLLQEQPNSSRVNAIVLAAAVESWADAQQILGERTIQDMVKLTTRKIDVLQKSGVNPPDFYTNLERKLQRKGLLNQASPKKETESRVAERTKPTPSKPIVSDSSNNDDSVTQRLNQRAAERLQSKAAAKEEAPVAVAKAQPMPSPGTSNPSAPPAVPVPAAPIAPTPAKQPTRLPKPSEQLVAQNKQEVREESEAAKLFRQGNVFLQANKSDEAIVAFQKSLRFDPDFADSYKKLGEIYMKKQDKDKALRSFKIYLQLKPESSDKQVVEGWISSLQ